MFLFQLRWKGMGRTNRSLRRNHSHNNRLLNLPAASHRRLTECHLIRCTTNRVYRVRPLVTRHLLPLPHQTHRKICKRILVNSQ